jgi:hypothetical protein
MTLTLLSAFCILAAPAQPEVTVYNQGFALVKESRNLSLKSGQQLISIEDVAAQIETNSVGIYNATDPNGFQVLEQNYQYDLINAASILNKAVGKRITFHKILPNGAKETVVGILMSAPSAVVSDQYGNNRSTYNGMVIKTDDGRILLNPTGEIEVDKIPEGMISKPTLVWDVIAGKAGANNIVISYLTKGMNWNADYVLTLNGAGAADLRGWVTMTNNSGATFKNAKLKLLAGDVNRVNRQPVMRSLGVRAKGMASDKKVFSEETLFEYHLYSLQRPATLKDKEIKQLSLLEGMGIKFEKKLIIDSMRDYGMYYPSEGEVGTGNLKPQVRVEFVNSKENNLGMPMPKGTIKVYQRDKSGSVQMLGEDQIDHTPKDEKISLAIGRSFDVVGERKRTNFTRLTPRSFRESFEIEVRNRKETSETVHVYERHYGDWKVTQKNMDFKKLDSITMDFVVALKAGESKKVIYTVETKW